MPWEKKASQHSSVLTEAAAVAKTNYCPFRVRYYNDGKRSITYEMLEVAAPIIPKLLKKIL